MRRVMRPPALLPLALAALLAIGASAGLHRAGEAPELIVLGILLTLAFFVILNLLLSVAASRRARPWISPGRGRGRGNGWDPAGTREPRRPRPPLMPSRAEALDPDSVAPEA